MTIKLTGWVGFGVERTCLVLAEATCPRSRDMGCTRSERTIWLGFAVAH